jgi:hypothetical protein
VVFVVCNKKNNERKILNLIYKDSEYEIHPSEEPDFLLIDKEHGYSFGVEITEFYINDSNARLRNIPHYGDDIITKGKYRHKKDIKELEVQELTITSSSNPQKVGVTEGVIMLPVLDVETYVQGIINRVVDKNDKISHYKVSPVNLIILDTEKIFNNDSIYREEIYELLFTEKLKAHLINSNFREIYLITEVERGKPIYIPLKMVYLITETRLLLDFIGDKYPELHILSPKEFLIISSHYLISRGVDNLYYKGTDDEMQIIYTNYGISLTDKGFLINDYYNCTLSKSFTPVNFSEYQDIISESFESDIQIFMKENTLAFKIGYDCLHE